jgi:ribonuclease D
MEGFISIFYHKFDLPEDVKFNSSVAIDTEAMGLNNLRDRLCVVQISSGDGSAHLVHFPKPNYDAPNLKKLLADDAKLKIFHFARFDVSIMQHYFQMDIKNIYCTKIASRLVRTYTDMHGLKDLCHELLDIKLNKQQQTSDWGAAELTKEQQSYAASDVLYLHKLKEKLDIMLKRENRLDIAQKCFDFLPTRAKLDTMGWPEFDIFQH